VKKKKPALACGYESVGAPWEKEWEGEPKKRRRETGKTETTGTVDIQKQNQRREERGGSTGSGQKRYLGRSYEGLASEGDAERRAGPEFIAMKGTRQTVSEHGSNERGNKN